MRVRFETSGGFVETEATAGERLLKVGQRIGMPLEGTCEGQMACATCHVIVAPEDAAKLPSPSENEEDLLDLAAHVTRTSRLACQIVLDGFDSLTVRLPGVVRNMQGR